MTEHSTLGARIKFLRVRKGWSIEQLGREAEVSKGLISTVENDRSQPSGRILMRLAKALGASIDYLVQGRSEANEGSRKVEIPPELLELAEQENWRVKKVRALLEAREAVIARRSDQARRPFTMHEWRELADRLSPYLDVEEE